jgi:hypothetical protein
MRRSEERRLSVLEAVYVALLTAALERCANGQWGLFGQNDLVLAKTGKRAQKGRSSPDIGELLEHGTQIEELRSVLGYSESFELHARLLQMRASNDANTAGEPKLARRWLDEMQE